MNRVGRKLLAAAVTAALALSLAACGGSSSASGSAQPAAQGSEEAAAGEAAQTETAAEQTEDAAQDRLARIKERGVLVVGTEGTYSPNSYHDENGDLVGFDVEVAALIAKYIGVDVQYYETEWKSIFVALDNGMIDTVVNEVGYTDERAQKYDFSEPYAFSRRCILVKGDNTDINSFEDLKGHTAANEASSLFGQMAEDYGADLLAVDKMSDSISSVLDGRADCTLNYETAFNDYMKEHPETDVKIVAYADPEPSSYVPVLKGPESDTLVAAINDALEQARRSGELAEISKKYFNGLDITANE